MITRKELLIKIGELESEESILNKIEESILRAAKNKERSITYIFSDKSDKQTRDSIHAQLENAGYTVGYSRYMTYADCFCGGGMATSKDEKSMIISW